MKRFIASAITLLCVACGGSGDEAASGSATAQRNARGAPVENAAPVIESAQIEPANPGASLPIEIAVVAHDPERDRVRVAVEWYRNGELVAGLDKMTVPAATFARGDRVYAIVYASDGHSEVSQQTAAVVIGNSAPTIRRVAITPAKATALDLLQAEVDVRDEDGDRVELRYRWLRNGQPVAESDVDRLPPGSGHRGETIVVQVRASDGDAESPWVASPPLTIGNAPPAITTQPNYSLSGSGQYSYEVAAKDPDGDRPLKYELAQGPQGMVVDIVSGRVTWNVPETAKGVYPIELRVSDPFGGVTTQKYSLAVDWSESPANASETARPSRTVKPRAAERDADYTDGDQAEEASEDEF